MPETKVSTETTVRKTIQLTEEEVADILRDHFKMYGADVEFDIGHGSILRGATITKTVTTTS